MNVTDTYDDKAEVLVLQHVDQHLYGALRERARAHQRSVGEEIVTLLRETVAEGVGGRAKTSQATAPGRKPETLTDLARRYFGPENGADLDIPARHTLRDRPTVDFSGNDYT